MNFIYHNQLYTIEYEDEIDIEILYSFALSIVEKELMILIQLPNIILFKSQPLPPQFTRTKPIFIITQEETFPIDDDYFYCCTKQISQQPFLQQTKNNTCKICLEICNQMEWNSIKYIPSFIYCQCNPNQFIYAENSDEIEMDENQRNSYLQQATNKAARNVFIQWIQMVEIELELMIKRQVL